MIEVVAEPMEPEPDRRDGGFTVSKLKRGVGPVLSGILIDLVDISTVSPLLGLALGALCGLWLSGHLKFAPRQRLLVALACGVYCMFPPTKFFPLATLLGFWATLRDS